MTGETDAVNAQSGHQLQPRAIKESSMVLWLITEWLEGQVASDKQKDGKKSPILPWKKKIVRFLPLCSDKKKWLM